METEDLISKLVMLESNELKKNKKRKSSSYIEKESSPKKRKLESRASLVPFPIKVKLETPIRIKTENKEQDTPLKQIVGSISNFGSEDLYSKLKEIKKEKIGTDCSKGSSLKKTKLVPLPIKIKKEKGSSSSFEDEEEEDTNNNDSNKKNQKLLLGEVDSSFSNQRQGKQYTPSRQASELDGILNLKKGKNGNQSSNKRNHLQSEFSTAQVDTCLNGHSHSSDDSSFEQEPQKIQTKKGSKKTLNLSSKIKEKKQVPVAVPLKVEPELAALDHNNKSKEETSSHAKKNLFSIKLVSSKKQGPKHSDSSSSGGSDTENEVATSKTENTLSRQAPELDGILKLKKVKKGNQSNINTSLNKHLNSDNSSIEQEPQEIQTKKGSKKTLNFSSKPKEKTVPVPLPLKVEPEFAGLNHNNTSKEASSRAKKKLSPIRLELSNKQMPKHSDSSSSGGSDISEDEVTTSKMDSTPLQQTPVLDAILKHKKGKKGNQSDNIGNHPQSKITGKELDASSNRYVDSSDDISFKQKPQEIQTKKGLKKNIIMSSEIKEKKQVPVPLPLKMKSEFAGSDHNNTSKDEVSSRAKKNLSPIRLDSSNKQVPKQSDSSSGSGSDTDDEMSTSKTESNRSILVNQGTKNHNQVGALSSKNTNSVNSSYSLADEPSLPETWQALKRDGEKRLSNSQSNLSTSSVYKKSPVKKLSFKESNWTETLQLNHPELKKQKMYVNLSWENSKYSLIRIPKNINPNILLGVKFSLNEEVYATLDNKEYLFQPLQKKPEPAIVNLNEPKLINLDRVIVLKKSEPLLPLNYTKLTKRENVSLPDVIKARHPLFGVDYKQKIKIEKNVKQKIHNAIESKIKLEKKKRKKQTKVKYANDLVYDEKSVLDLLNLDFFQNNGARLNSSNLLLKLEDSDILKSTKSAKKQKRHKKEHDK